MSITITITTTITTITTIITISTFVHTRFMYLGDIAACYLNKVYAP